MTLGPGKKNICHVFLAKFATLSPELTDDDDDGSINELTK